jgi:hypothetical protein
MPTFTRQTDLTISARKTAGLNPKAAKTKQHSIIVAARIPNTGWEAEG